MALAVGLFEFHQYLVLLLKLWSETNMLRKSISCVVLGLVVAIVLSTSANAAILGTAALKGNPAGVPFGSPDAALAAPWKSYSLDIAGNAGEIIAAVDVSISGLTGLLHQRWTFDEDAGAFVQTPNSANQTNGDSHLRAIAGALFGSGPTENNPGTGSPLPDSATADYGVGTSLAGAWGIPGPSQTANASLAYIVIQDQSIPDLDVIVKVANGLGEIISTLGCSDFFGAACGGTPGEIPVVTDFTESADILNEVIATTLTATNTPTSWSNLLLPTYAPMFGALPTAPGLLVPPTWNPATQQFSFNTAGSTRGRYTWTVDATNATGTSTGEGRGLITVDVTQVPEPASIALFGLALVGFVGFARRRS